MIVFSELEQVSVAWRKTSSQPTGSVNSYTHEYSSYRVSRHDHMQFLACSVMPGVGPTPVEIPQVQFLDKLSMPVVVASGANGQTAQKTVEIPQLQFLDKGNMSVVV